MRNYAVRIRAIIVLICIVIFISCRKDAVHQEASISSTHSSEASVVSPIQGEWKTISARLAAARSSLYKTDEYFATEIESECTATRFDKVVTEYFSEFGSFEYGMYPEYATVNQLYTFIDSSKQYFGKDGEYTNLVIKQQRKLESFWHMPNIVQIIGEHNSTMKNRDKIAKVYITFSHATPEAAYELADQLLAINSESTIFVETPLISFDAFATTSHRIVLGDGIVQALTEAGVEGDIAVAGTISHEWGHQVQFANSKKWYGFDAGERPQTAEFTRQMEMEADFLSGYFLTHKHGGTHSWKKVASFSELFFNIGDCDVTNSGHHGTPRQRLAAAALGYFVGNTTMPKGHILSPDALHKTFVQHFNRLLKA